MVRHGVRHRRSFRRQPRGAAVRVRPRRRRTRRASCALLRRPGRAACHHTVPGGRGDHVHRHRHRSERADRSARCLHPPTGAHGEPAPGRHRDGSPDRRADADRGSHRDRRHGRRCAGEALSYRGIARDRADRARPGGGQVADDDPAPRWAARRAGPQPRAPRRGAGGLPGTPPTRHGDRRPPAHTGARIRRRRRCRQDSLQYSDSGPSRPGGRRTR